MTSEARQKAEARGRSAERLALLRLILSGWWPLAQRARTPMGEIDLIVRRGRVVAFVEVKRRANLASAMQAITPMAQGRIARSAQWWLARHPHYGDHTLRFDVVAITPRAWPHHIPNAFTA